MAIGLTTAITAQSADAKKKRPKPAKVNVNIATKNQAQLIKAKRLAVKVRSTGKTRVVLQGFKGRNGRLFKKRAVRFNKRATKTVALALTANGRKQLANCGAQQVRVVGTYKRGKRKAKAKRAKRLARDASRCVQPINVDVGSDPQNCDFLDPAVCLQPFPNDYYTKDDSSTATGKRLNLGAKSTPANIQKQHMSVEDINRADGFSPGNQIILKVPGLETQAAFDNSNLVPITDLHAYADPNQAVMVIDAETGERHPIWAEIDENPTAVDPSNDGPGGPGLNPTNTAPVNLIVRPAKNFESGKRYIVAFRNLKDASNNTIQAPNGFVTYRDKRPTSPNQPVVEARRPHMESILNTLTSKAGVDRKSLYMAWDFTVASEQSVTGRATQIRDEAFKALNDNNLANRVIEGNSPTWVIDEVKTPGNGILKEIEGKITNIPCFLNENGCPSGAQFEFDAAGKVKRNPAYTVDTPFRCVIPESVIAGGTVNKAKTGIYGHGLLGSFSQVGGQNQYANETNTIWCAMNWDGFSSGDMGTVLSALADMSNFNKIADRMQQGFVNFMYLQRAMIHQNGFATDPAFDVDAGGGVTGSSIDVSAGANTRGQYMGISQGGIMGGALMALTPDADRGVLGVPGMNYSTLLRRSVDSDEYFKNPTIGLYKYYPDELTRPLLLSLVQLLWDRGEANGYAHHLSNKPLANTPPHEVLLRVAFGDHQVANITAENMARTAGMSIYAPALNPGRHWDVNPYLGINQVSSFPFSNGSMLVYYDGGPVGYFNDTVSVPGTPSECNHGNPVADPCEGSGTPPNGNLPPREEWGYGDDPHAYPRRSVDGISHGKSFLENGTINVCHSGSYCYSNNYNGPN